MKRALLSGVAIALSLAALALPTRAQTSLQIFPEQGVGVLSADPGFGQRWSTNVFPFGNYVGSVSGEDISCRTYLRFPLREIPAGVTVESVTLSVYVDDFWPGPGSAPMSVYPVAADWPEGEEWNDVSAWPVLGEAVMTTTVTSEEGWFTWDVTPLVWDWLQGTPNHGLAVAAAPGSAASNWAAARRLTAEDLSTRPYLEITFSEPAPTPTSPRPTPTSPPPPRPSTPTPHPPTPIPPPTATPGPILLPVTGRTPLRACSWFLLLLAGGGVGLLTALRGSRMHSRD